MTNTDTTRFDARMLITAANACYAQARDKALPPPVRAKIARAADALVAAVDAHHESTAPPAPNIGGYDKDRCRVCSRPWPLHVIDCANNVNRPLERPEWLDKAVAAETEAVQLRNGTASDLPPVANDATKARREVAGGAPTRGWRDGRAGSGAMNGGLSDK